MVCLPTANLYGHKNNPFHNNINRFSRIISSPVPQQGSTVAGFVTRVPSGCSPLGTDWQLLRSIIPPPRRPPQDDRFLQVSLVHSGSSQQRKKEEKKNRRWVGPPLVKKKKEMKKILPITHMSSHYSATSSPPPPAQRCLLQAPSIRPIDPVSPWCGTCLFRGLSEKDGSAAVMYFCDAFLFFQRQPRPWGTLQGEPVSGIQGRKCSLVLGNGAAPGRNC